MPLFATNPNIAGAYDDWAETYDTVPNLTRDMAGRALRQVELDYADRMVIEVGCGTGRNTAWLARHAAHAKEILGLDFSGEMLARARVRVQDARVHFRQHDIRTTWPVADSKADLIIAMLVLEHVEHLDPIFAEAARALKLNGELFICEFHPARQLQGMQARFTNARTGESTLVSAFLHRTEDYINAGISSGFELMRAIDWDDPNANADAAPQLLSLQFRLTSPATL